MVTERGLAGCQFLTPAAPPTDEYLSPLPV